MAKFVPFIKLQRQGYAHNDLTSHAYVYVAVMSIRTMVRFATSTQLMVSTGEEGIVWVTETPEEIIALWEAARG